MPLAIKWPRISLMTAIFDGRELASEKLKEVAKEVKELKKSGVTPKLVSIFVGDDPASKLYLGLKKKRAEDVGAQVEVVKLEKDIKTEKLKEVIRQLNKNEKVHGIMVQLPLPKLFTKSDRAGIINSISYQKDVDGLGENSLFITPVVKAVLVAVKEGTNYITRPALKVVVIGASGFEGGKIARSLKEMGYEVGEIASDTKNLEPLAREADILISVTGVPGLIGEGVVKDGAIVIDVGSPKGDVKTQEVQQKAAFISPVPGGIGPVTIACLLENLVLAAGSIAK